MKLNAMRYKNEMELKYPIVFPFICQVNGIIWVKGFLREARILELRDSLRDLRVFMGFQPRNRKGFPPLHANNIRCYELIPDESNHMGSYQMVSNDIELYKMILDKPTNVK